ncbi:hypothetical protein D3C80_1360500 [compost metagenome]
MAKAAAELLVAKALAAPVRAAPILDQWSVSCNDTSASSFDLDRRPDPKDG